jgi:hypothetical protein
MASVSGSILAVCSCTVLLLVNALGHSVLILLAGAGLRRAGGVMVALVGVYLIVSALHSGS